MTDPDTDEQAERASDSWDGTLYDDTHGFVHDHGRSMISELDPSSWERILDPGCGTTHLSEKIAEGEALVVRHRPVDGEPQTAVSGELTAKLVQSDATALPFGIGSFDAVFSNAVFH